MSDDTCQRGHCADCLNYTACVTCCECGGALVPYRPDIEVLIRDRISFDTEVRYSDDTPTERARATLALATDIDQLELNA